MTGIDVSENNGVVDWEQVRNDGIQFAIIRLGFGNRHLDSQFEANVKGALAQGLLIGVYYYSYALDENSAQNEAEFFLEALEKCGVRKEDIRMGCWFDMEDADGYKDRHGMPNNETITAICSRFICTLNEEGLSCGIYASLDWLENIIQTDELADYVPYWVAQWSSNCDWSKNVKLWQYTNCLQIGYKYFDGNYTM